MYKVLDKNTIEMEIILYIPGPKRGFPPTMPLAEVIYAILYKLKTGVQWEQLPDRSLFTGKARKPDYHYSMTMDTAERDHLAYPG